MHTKLGSLIHCILSFTVHIHNPCNSISYPSVRLAQACPETSLNLSYKKSLHKWNYQFSLPVNKICNYRLCVYIHVHIYIQAYIFTCVLSTLRAMMPSLSSSFVFSVVSCNRPMRFTFPLFCTFPAFLYDQYTTTIHTVHVRVCMYLCCVSELNWWFVTGYFLRQFITQLNKAQFVRTNLLYIYNGGVIDNL